MNHDDPRIKQWTEDYVFEKIAGTLQEWKELSEYEFVNTSDTVVTKSIVLNGVTRYQVDLKPRTSIKGSFNPPMLYKEQETLPEYLARRMKEEDGSK